MLTTVHAVRECVTSALGCMRAATRVMQTGAHPQLVFRLTPCVAVQLMFLSCSRLQTGDWSQ